VGADSAHRFEPLCAAVAKRADGQHVTQPEAAEDELPPTPPD
jgi:hypothetical protein